MVSFPANRVLTYETLADEIRCKIDGDLPFVLLGESFSGPLALRLAADHPNELIGVVLVATFIRPPVPGWLRYLPWNAIFCFRAPLYILRVLLTGSRDAAVILRRTSRIIRNVQPRVLASRVCSVLTVDARTWLRSCPVPILYLAASHDRLVRRHCLDEILTHRHDVIQRCIPSPHFLLQLAPTEAWTAISDFVAEAGKTRVDGGGGDA